MSNARNKHFVHHLSSHCSKSKSTERKSQTTNNSFLNYKQTSFIVENNTISSKDREKKFSIFLYKHGANHISKHSKPFIHNTRIDILYEHAKVQSALKDKLRSEIRSKAYQNEKSQCTFNPKINNKSRSMMKTDQEVQSIYQRGILWANMKIEKIKHEKKIKMIKESEFSYHPNIEPLNNKKRKINDDNKRNMFQDLSIVSFFERQETARKARTSREKKIAHRYYSAQQVTLTKKASANNITKGMLNKYKAILHKELAHSMKHDETNDTYKE